MDEYVTIYIPRNAIPVLNRKNNSVLVSMSGGQRLICYGEAAQFKVAGKAVAEIFMGKKCKKV